MDTSEPVLHLAADALEAKAAPVGELRQAFEEYCQSIGYTLKTGDSGRYLGGYGAELWAGFKAGAAHQRQQATDWQPSGADYDRSIHSNPDAKAWADFFVATFPGLSDKHELMIGWFANAMMAMHDYLKAQQAREVVMPERKAESVRGMYQELDFVDGWNACLDEFARLKDKEVFDGH